MVTWFVALHSSFVQFGWRRAPWLQEGCSFQMMLRVTPGSLFVFSLRGRLTLLVIVAVLPLLCLVLAEVYLTYRSDRARFSGRAQDYAHAHALSQALQADHQVRMAALQTLALSPALRAGDVEAFRPVAPDFIAMQPKGSTLGLADETGQLLLAVSAVPEGMPLPRRRNMAAQERVFRGGQPVVSDLFTNAINGRHSYTVEAPVIRDGRVLYDLGLDPTPASLAEVVSQQQLDEGWVASIIDAQGIVVARYPRPEQFIGRPTSASLLTLLKSRSEGSGETISLEGMPLLTAFSRSEPSGWRVAVGVPREVVYGPSWRRALFVLGSGAVVLMISLTASAALARRITAPIAQLGRFAEEIAGRSGPTPVVEETGMGEVDEVGRVLAAATTSLRDLADTLEHRVAEEVAERIRTEEVLRQSQKMEAVGQLTAGVAHDFNNLLQAQMAGLELLLDAVQGQERATRCARMALASCEKGAKLTHSLLSFSRQQMLRPEAVDTPALLTRLEGLLSRTLDPRIGLRIEVEARLVSPQADSA
jgi:signal transduction histidine kinase